MVPVSSASQILIVVSDGTTALAYYWLTYQLLNFAFNEKVNLFRKDIYIRTYESY
jgi:hypothetical protein